MLMCAHRGSEIRGGNQNCCLPYRRIYSLTSNIATTCFLFSGCVGKAVCFVLFFSFLRRKSLISVALATPTPVVTSGATE